MADDPINVPLLLAKIDSLVERQSDLTKRLDHLTQSLAASYVPKGEYGVTRDADDRRFAEIEKDIEAQASFRRQVAAGALIGLLLLVAQIVVTLGQTGGAS